MAHVALTGANGFVGWHLRAALQEDNLSAAGIPVGDAFESSDASKAASGASRFIHVAGINRASDEDVLAGNVRFARQAAESIVRADNPPPVVVYANSSQAGNGTVYGDAKARAADILAEAAAQVGATFEDIKLPNLFGEHGRPFYNAVTSTFCHLLASGEEPTVNEDKELTLLHVQSAADLLSGAAARTDQSELEERETVVGISRRLAEIAATYSRGEIPDVSSRFGRDLFNTYRSYTFPAASPVGLSRHADERGSFFEIIRSHGGPGQSSFSTTAPGISRGDHFHRRKIERFTVLAGTATIALRKVFTDEVITFEVTGDKPVAVDMPTMWSHKITNTGAETLYTSFWTNDIFNPDAPDTIAETV